MPPMVKELAQGNTFGRSADGGNLADQAQRVFKIILNSPNESVDIFAAIGVRIGDPYSASNPIPCTSIEGRADGESRLVRIVTATYRTTPGDDGSGQDPKTQPPDVRQANFSTSTSLYEAPAYVWVKYPGNNSPGPVVNALGDPMDGVTKMDAITTIRITQFSATPGTIHSQYCGYINQETMSLGGYLACPPHTVLFRGVEAQPHVETFGDTAYRGFMNSYEFAFRSNYVEGHGMCGWDATPLHTGFNVMNSRLNAADVDSEALTLMHDDDRTYVVEPFQFAQNAEGKVGRAMVMIPGANKKRLQQPSAQPVALNEDGTPRSRSASPKVLIWRRQVQNHTNLTQTLGLRLT